MRIRMSVGITIRIIKGGRITTGIICIKNGNNNENNNSIQNNNKYNNIKRTMTSWLTVVGKQGRQTHGRTHNMFFAHTIG
jgi:hypothetical protein